ncbi:TraB/GumN family protein [Photobacterium rosenbergii]|uniref:TraB/GumN family protein n=1 Tax=Photobacterium rosenbergii TaxID=294936 RepID=A0ABU3ZL31_9GAMM|nr:TraB/GumN family protein [Photobacterium rosenbergii]MDV5170835.1 TraB/GumN family protein [Photobacterium rosenbergii]
MLKALVTRAALLLPFITTSVVAEPLVWQAQDAQREFIILGSIHAGEDDFYPLPNAFTSHWDSADALVVEANILKPSSAQLNPAVATTTEMLTETEKQSLAAIAKLAGLSSSPLLSSPPWLAAISLQMKMAEQAGLSPNRGVDITLLKRAQASQLPILELESVEKQLRLMEQLDDHGKNLLMVTVNEWDKMTNQLTCLISAWQAGDQTQLDSLFDESQYNDDTDAALIVDRNRDWATKLIEDPAFQRGKFLIVVGAMHLLGEEGLPELLKQKGFSINQLSQSKQVSCS